MDEARPDIYVELGELLPGLSRAEATDQTLSVQRAHMFGGVFEIDREHPRLRLDWRGNHTIDSLAMRATGCTEEVADRLLARGDMEGDRPAEMTNSRLKRLMGRSESALSRNLPGLIGRAFREELFVITQVDPAVRELLEQTEQVETALADLSNAATGMSRSESAAALNVTDVRLGHFRTRVLLPALGIDTMQAGVTRGFLGRVL